MEARKGPDLCSFVLRACAGITTASAPRFWSRVPTLLIFGFIVDILATRALTWSGTRCLLSMRKVQENNNKGSVKKRKIKWKKLVLLEKTCKSIIRNLPIKTNNPKMPTLQPSEIELLRTTGRELPLTESLAGLACTGMRTSIRMRNRKQQRTEVAGGAALRRLSAALCRPLTRLGASDPGCVWLRRASFARRRSPPE